MPSSQRVEPWLVWACLACSALVIDFGAIHGCHNSDSIVMVLLSLHRWTPLCWEMDRLGMVFPLLATPWHHPLDNLLAQGAMTTLAGLSAPFLLGWYSVGLRRGTAVGALGGIFLIAFCRLDQQFEFLIVLQQNAQALAIGLAGLLLLQGWARGRGLASGCGGIACLLVAHWLNPGLAFVLAPLLIVRGLCFRNLGEELEWLDDQFTPRAASSREASRPNWRLRPSRDEMVGLVAIALSMAASMALSRLVAEPKGYHVMPVREWFSCAATMWRELHVLFPHRWFEAIEVTAGVGLLTLLHPAGRTALRRSWPLATGLLAVAVVQYVLMSALDHVRDNHSARYIVLAVLLWQGALVGFAVIQVSAVLRDVRWIRAVPLGLTVAMTLLVAVRHGVPSAAVVHDELDRTLGQYTDDILAAECTHVTGDYWHVWTAMYHANLRLADQRSPRVVWGIAYRSRATQDQWRAMPWTDARIAEIVGDERQSAEFRQQYRVPSVIERGRRGTIRVLAPSGPWDSGVELARQPSEQNSQQQ